jgi:hypothetical protein
MSFKYLNYLIATCLVLGCMAWIASADAAQPGFLEGHLKIILSREVDLADGTPAPVTAENYAEHPLIILSADRKQEVTRATADKNGNYRVELPPGDYVLDVQRRPRGRLRASPQPFTVASGQTVHVDMDVDMGVR